VALADQRYRLLPTGAASVRVATSVLELFLPQGWPQSQAPIHWTARTGTDITWGEVGALEDLPESVRRHVLLVWTPPADTLLTQAILPTRNRRKIAQALPFALEEQLLGDPASLHFAYQRHDEEALAVAVTTRERMQTWLQALHDARLQPTRLCPATLSLPLDVDDWALAFVDGWIWLRTSPYAGVVCPATNNDPPTLVAAALKEARGTTQVPTRLTVFNAPPDFAQEQWKSALEVEITVSEQSLWEARVNATPPLDLLQGDFAPARGLRKQLQPLLPAAIIASIWLVGTLGFTVGNWWQLDRKHHSYQQVMTALFRQTFPDAKVVLDPALQMQRNLETLQAQTGGVGSGDLLPLLAGVAPVMRTNPKVSLRTLKYEDAKLTLDLRLPDFEALEKIKNAMNASTKVRAEVLAANSRGSEVEGRLRIEVSRDISAGNQGP
jgi:general secretion pathway protein L